MVVNNTFLNGVIDEEVYIEKPIVLFIHGKEFHVFRFKKAL